MKAVCIQCGATKSMPWKVCPSCRFRPSEKLDLAKSVYLSEGRYEAGSERADYRAELSKASEALRAGEEVEYDEFELDRLLAQKALVDSVPLSAVWGAVFRFFRPALIFIGVLVVLYLVLRVLNS